MLRTLITFAPVAALLTITPGVATALVVRSAACGGRRQAFFTTAGNSVGVLAWSVLAAAGLAAVVAASSEAFTAVKFAGALVLIAMGVLSLRGRRPDGGEVGAIDRLPRSDVAALRGGLLTSMANPKLAVFFVALFPQFVPAGAPVLPAALALGAMIVSFDLVWYSLLALFVTRAKRAFARSPWSRRAERLTGVVLIGLGIRLALAKR
jgi:threonine/homoserine/homoserine lactone efflux protein